VNETVASLVLVGMALIYAGLLARSVLRFNREQSEKLREWAREHREAMERLTRSTLESGRVMNPEPTPSQAAHEEMLARKYQMDPREARAEHKAHLSTLNDIALGKLRKP
jgi:hypothetical protein